MNLKSACAAVFTAAVAATAAGEPGLARFVYARNTFVTNFYSDVWTKRGQSMDTPKDVPLPEIEGWRQKRERAMVLQGALTVAKDGEYLFRSANREEIVVAGCRRFLTGGDTNRVVRLAKGAHPIRRIVVPRGPWRENGRVGLEWKRVGDADWAEIPPEAYSYVAADLQRPDLFASDVKMTLLPGRGAWLAWDLDVPETGFYVLNIRRNGSLRWGGCCPEQTVGFWLDDRHVRHYYGTEPEGGILDEEPLPLWLEKGRHRLDARGENVEKYLVNAPRLFFRRAGTADTAAETLTLTLDKTPGESVFRMGEEIEWTLRRATLDCARTLPLKLEVVRQRTTDVVFEKMFELPAGKACAEAKAAFPKTLAGAFEYAVKDAAGKVLEGPWQFLVIDAKRRETNKFAAQAVDGDCFDDPATFGVKVDEIDFGREDLGGAHKVRDNGTSRVVTAGDVRYRETGPERRGIADPVAGRGHLNVVDWFGFTLKLRHPGVAHLAVFELPNDRFRRFPVELLDPQTGHWNGAYYEILQAAKPGTVRMIIPFWPNETEIDGILMPSNTHNDPRSTPAAVAKVTLYECPDGFPALPAAKAGWNPDRLVGWGGEQGDLSPERTTTPPIRPDGKKVPMVVTGNGGIYYDYTAYGLAWQRFGEFSAWQGHNYLRWPIHSYGMAHVQTERLPWGNSLFSGYEPSHRTDKYRRNTLKIILLNCEKYGIRFYGDMQVNCNVGKELAKGLTLKGILETDKAHPKNRMFLESIVRAEKVDDIAALEGAFLLEHNNLGGNLNPSHPLARRYYANFFGDIAKFCRDLPAFAGMNIRHWPGFSSTYGAWWTDARAGYDDWTLRQYAKETGAEVPLAEKDVVAREKFLLDDPARREKWFRWRADKVTSLKAEILAAMRKYRPDARLQITTTEQSKPFVELGMGLDNAVADKDLGLSLRTASIRRQGNECNKLDPVRMAGFDLREGVEYVKPEDKYGKGMIYPMGLNTGSAMFAPPSATKQWAEAMAEGPLDFADEGVYWAFPAGNKQLRRWIRAFRALPKGDYVKVPAPVAEPDVVCWKAGRVAYFTNLRPYPVRVVPSSPGRDLVNGGRFEGELTVVPYGLRVVETDRELTGYLKPSAATRFEVRVQNPSGARRDRTVVTLPADRVLGGGKPENLRLYCRGRELPVQIDPAPLDEVAFLYDFKDGEKEAAFEIRFDRGRRPDFPAPFKLDVHEAPGKDTTNWHVRVDWGTHAVGFRDVGIGYIAEGGKPLYTGRRTPRNAGWRLFGMRWTDAKGEEHPRPVPAVLAQGPVRLVVGCAWPEEDIHWENAWRQDYLYPSLRDSRVWRLYQVRAGGDTVEIVNRYRYARAVGHRINAATYQESSWLEPLTPMEPKVVYCLRQDGAPGESHWVQKADAKGVAGTFEPCQDGTWFAFVDRSLGCGWGYAIDPAYASYRGQTFGQFHSTRFANEKIPETFGFDMRQELRLFPSDPGAEKAAALAARAFEDPPVVTVRPVN